jgi:hypothetical protein
MIQLAVIIASAILWHLGGQGHKWCRQIVGGVIGLGKAILLGNPWALLYWLLLYLMVQGFSYGLTSPVHKFWAWVFVSGSDGNDWRVEMVTRATCGFMWSLAGALFWVLTGNGVNLTIYVILCTTLVTFFGLHKKVQVSEMGTGATVALSILI